MINQSNYLNVLWEGCYNVFKQHFSNYHIDTKPWNEVTVEKPTILLLSPRTNFIRIDKEYNGINEYPFILNIFCLSNDDGGASKLAGEVTAFVNKNQHLFSAEPNYLRRATITSSEEITNDGSESLYVYQCVLRGFCLF